MNTSAILLIPQKTDIEQQQVVSAWGENGGRIKRLDKFWIKNEDLANQRIAIYGNLAFAFVVAQIYNVERLSPDDTLIAKLEDKWTKRIVQLKTIEQLSAQDFPTFIKPVVPKIFVAGFFQSLEDFQEIISGLPITEEILVATIVTDILAEARCYICDGVIMDIAFYEGSADLQEGEKFVSDFITDYKDHLPSVVVVDIAFSEKTGWFVLEFNACWGAGLNNCKAEKIVDCIIGATINIT
ncbi:protein of unknown function [Filimonas lacunae]|uniref:ATP-grasp domain-containing protein n=1 Tax=Filimonas lacunae TaxID=477680 RepID=A0A173MPQ8_9BACT|nr:ATP-grasp domain-containing protein [Filimonas lacunae]BAV09675.1 hypothetical protein FLA_5728 [Filimonas lacunae]SIS77048.1 protein of unknown function [Filimonas lacunae]